MRNTLVLSKQIISSNDVPYSVEKNGKAVEFVLIEVTPGTLAYVLFILP